MEAEIAAKAKTAGEAGPCFYCGKACVKGETASVLLTGPRGEPCCWECLDKPLEGR